MRAASSFLLLLLLALLLQRPATWRVLCSLLETPEKKLIRALLPLHCDRLVADVAAAAAALVVSVIAAAAARVLSLPLLLYFTCGAVFGAADYNCWAAANSYNGSCCMQTPSLRSGETAAHVVAARRIVCCVYDLAFSF